MVSWAIIGMFLVFYGVYRVVDMVSVVLRPFIFATVIVLVLRPGLTFMEKRGVPRLLALALAYIAFFAGLTLIMLFLVPLIITEVNQLIKAFPSYSRMLEQTVLRLQDRYNAFRSTPQARQMIQSVLTNVQESGLSALGNVPGVTISFLSLILDFVLAPIIAFFVLMDRARIRRGLARLLPERIRPQSMYVAYRINTALTAVLRTMLIIALTLGTFYSIGLFIIGVPYALIIGFAGGILELIPYVGPFISLVIAVIVTAATKGGWYAFGIAIYFFVLGNLESVLITPLLMKGQVGAPPLLSVTVLLLGGALFGFWGALLALPLAAITYEIGSFLLASPEEKQQLVREFGSQA